jgi:hypothetical protein
MAHPPPAQTLALQCARCRRPDDQLESWLERRRLKTPSGEPGGYSYSHRIVEHMICADCYRRVRRGAPAVVNNGMKVLAAFIAGALLVAACLPLIKPNLVSAFWRNGAAPSGWHEGHTERPADFRQGRF